MTLISGLLWTQGYACIFDGSSSSSRYLSGASGRGHGTGNACSDFAEGNHSRTEKIVATVSTLEAEVKRQGIQTPAIIVVGKVCALADEFNWYEKLPLMGWKVLVTRPKNRSSRTTELLREKERRFWSFLLSVPRRWKIRPRFIRR